MSEEPSPRLLDNGINIMVGEIVSAKKEEIIDEILSCGQSDKRDLVDNVATKLRSYLCGIADEVNADKYVQENNRTVSITMEPVSKSYLRPELEAKRKTTKDIKEYLDLTISAEYSIECFVERGV